MKNYGLQPHKHDRRDYSHKKTFGAPLVSDLPDEYILPSTVLDQGSSYHCTAYAACAIQESQEGIGFDPEDFYRAEGVINGEVSNFGYDLRTAMKTGVKYGFYPLSGGNPADYKEGSYYSIDSPLNRFDGIRQAIWSARTLKKLPEGGVHWYNEWTYAKAGIIPEVYNQFAGLHAVKIAGWKKILGQDYLVIQNSYATSCGDGGFFYMPRSVVQKELSEGLFMWRTPEEEGQQVKTIGLMLSLMTQVMNLLIKLYNNTLGRL